MSRHPSLSLSVDDTMGKLRSSKVVQADFEPRSIGIVVR
jgi:hypothetical protein